MKVNANVRVQGGIEGTTQGGGDININANPSLDVNIHAPTMQLEVNTPTIRVEGNAGVGGNMGVSGNVGVSGDIGLSK
jgi:hypothetical protein